MSLATLQVGVFEEHEVFRYGLAVSLSEDPLIDVVVSAERATPAVFEAHELDVVVAAATAVGACRLPCPAVLLAGPSGVPETAARQAWALLPRHTVAPQQLTSAVRAAAVGLRIAEAVVRRPALDDRALRVLRLLADGADTREIAALLGWSERTIKGVIAAAEHTLGARTRAHAVATAVRQALI